MLSCLSMSKNVFVIWPITQKASYHESNINPMYSGLNLNYLLGARNFLPTQNKLQKNENISASLMFFLSKFATDLP